MSDANTYDYIVVGGGSAGCVVTNRLVQAGHQVLLLEAGPPDDSLFVRMPATFVRVLGTRRTWVYETQPQPEAKGRRMYVPQGRTLGGGSSVNAMIYVRGQAQDYDAWEAAGCAGWGWQDVLPWFRHAEANQRLSGSLHGTQGPLRVSDTRHRHALSYGFIQAAQEVGLPYNGDFNGERQEGVGFYQTTTHEGARASTAATYLAAVRRWPGLRVVTGALAEQVRVEDGRAVGVNWRDEQGRRQAATARHEVILAAGALATPKLLMLSGIGPGGQLQALGIPVVADAPDVGRNFQDHLEVSVYGRCREPVSLYGQDRGLTALRHGAQWQFTRTGVLTSNVVESGGFVDTTGSGRPDIQFHVLPVLVGDVDRSPLDGHGISINPCFLRPASRGAATLTSRDAAAPLRLEAGFLSERSDLDALLRGVRLARRILQAPSLARHISEELTPWSGHEPSEAELEDWVRSRAKTVYHPAGTCRMGAASDPGAVVAPDLRVKGVRGLRVCDASVMPQLVSGNTNAPTVMIAERCAAFIAQQRGAAVAAVAA